MNDARAYIRRVTRVDPESNGVSGRFEMDVLSGMAIGDGTVWLGGDDVEGGGGGLIRISP